jgi:hypothetical protein
MHVYDKKKHIIRKPSNYKISDINFYPFQQNKTTL